MALAAPLGTHHTLSPPVCAAVSVSMAPADGRTLPETSPLADGVEGRTWAPSWGLSVHLSCCCVSPPKPASAEGCWDWLPC